MGLRFDVSPVNKRSGGGIYAEGLRQRLHIRGKTMSYQGHVLDISVEEKAYLLQQYLAQFPQDAPYHEVTLDKGKKPKDSDIALASESAVVVEFNET